jgi:hypothetical protein
MKFGEEVMRPTFHQLPQSTASAKLATDIVARVNSKKYGPSVELVRHEVRAPYDPTAFNCWHINNISCRICVYATRFYIPVPNISLVSLPVQAKE